MTDLKGWILEKLAPYTGFEITADASYICVSCQNHDSFDVWIHVDADSYIVGFDGWHAHFDTRADALNCFAFGLLAECRLKVIHRGRMQCRWTLQSRENGDWVSDTTTGLIFVPFWRQAVVTYRQNRLLKTPDPAA